MTKVGKFAEFVRGISPPQTGAMATACLCARPFESATECVEGKYKHHDDECLYDGTPYLCDCRCHK